MHPNEELLQSFYTSFARRDAEGMVACYGAKVRFSDPVFPNLEGSRAGDMWRMLCQRGKDLQVTFGNLSADATRGRVSWEARYTYSATGKPVHNRIEAHFVFQDGAIVEHRDDFDLYRWTCMALGLKGRLLGWLPPVQAAIRRQAASALDRFVLKRAEEIPPGSPR